MTQFNHYSRANRGITARLRSLHDGLSDYSFPPLRHLFLGGQLKRKGTRRESDFLPGAPERTVAPPAGAIGWQEPRLITAYVLVGWLFLQLSDVMLDFTEAPAWIGKVIIVLFVLGFFVALVLSWLFEITPDGIHRDDGSAKVDHVRGERLNILTIAAAISIAALFAWQQLLALERTVSVIEQDVTPVELAESTKGTSIDDAAIAVLLFADLSSEGDQEYFSDGISEEILNVLVAIDELEVASRTSAFAA